MRIGRSQAPYGHHGGRNVVPIRLFRARLEPVWHIVPRWKHVHPGEGSHPISQFAQFGLSFRFETTFFRVTKSSHFSNWLSSLSVQANISWNAWFVKTAWPSILKKLMPIWLFSKIERKRRSLDCKASLARLRSVMSDAVTTAPLMVPSSRIGKEEYSTGIAVPSRRHNISSSVLHPFPLLTAWDTGHSFTG